MFIARMLRLERRRQTPKIPDAVAATSVLVKNAAAA
jgi:hypothetical protein